MHIYANTSKPSDLWWHAGQAKATDKSGPLQPMPRTRTNKTFAHVMDPKNMHRNGMHNGHFNDGCAICHKEDRASGATNNTGPCKDCHSVALGWLASLRPCRFSLKRTVEALANLRNASSVVAPSMGPLTWLLVLRDSFHAFVHGGGLLRLGIELHSVTYIVVAKLDGNAPFIFHGKQRELISAFACAIGDGFETKRYELLQKLYEKIDLDNSVFLNQPGTHKVCVMYFCMPPFAKWESVAYHVMFGSICANGANHVFRDNDEEQTTLDSTYPVKLIQSGNVELECADADTLRERRIFADNVITYNTDGADDGECTRCTQLTAIVSNLQRQRNDLVRDAEKREASPTKQTSVDESDSTAQQALLIDTLRSELHALEDEHTHVSERAMRAEAELALLREDDTDKKKLMATVQELHRQAGVVKRDRKSEKCAFASLRSESKQEILELNVKLEATLCELSATKNELSVVRRANAALCSDGEETTTELERLESALAEACSAKLGAQQQCERLTSELKNIRAHPPATQAHVPKESKSTSTYTDTKQGSIELEPGLMERAERISQLQKELNEAKVKISTLTVQVQESDDEKGNACDRVNKLPDRESVSPQHPPQIAGPPSSPTNLADDVSKVRERLHAEVDKLATLASTRSIQSHPAQIQPTTLVCNGVDIAATMQQMQQQMQQLIYAQQNAQQMHMQHTTLTAMSYDPLYHENHSPNRMGYNSPHVSHFPHNSGKGGYF